MPSSALCWTAVYEDMIAPLNLSASICRDGLLLIRLFAASKAQDVPKQVQHLPLQHMSGSQTTMNSGSLHTCHASHELGFATCTPVRRGPAAVMHAKLCSWCPLFLIQLAVLASAKRLI